jgi:hypothetical protein
LINSLDILNHLKLKYLAVFVSTSGSSSQACHLTHSLSSYEALLKRAIMDWKHPLGHGGQGSEVMQEKRSKL